MHTDWTNVFLTIKATSRWFFQPSDFQCRDQWSDHWTNYTRTFHVRMIYISLLGEEKVEFVKSHISDLRCYILIILKQLPKECKSLIVTLLWRDQNVYLLIFTLLWFRKAKPKQREDQQIHILLTVAYSSLFCEVWNTCFTSVIVCAVTWCGGIKIILLSRESINSQGKNCTKFPTTL